MGSVNAIYLTLFIMKLFNLKKYFLFHPFTKYVPLTAIDKNDRWGVIKAAKNEKFTKPH